MHFITGMYSLSLYITTCHARDGVSDTPEHSDDIYLPSSSLIGDPDTVAWLRAARCTATGRHRASQAAIACTASLHRTPPFQAAKSKAFLIISGRGAAVSLVALRRDLDPSHLRTPHTLMLGRRPPHAQGPCACGAVLGFVRRPPCGERQGSRIISARASKGVKSHRTCGSLISGCQMSKIFSGSASGRRGHAPHGRRGQVFCSTNVIQTLLRI